MHGSGDFCKVIIQKPKQKALLMPEVRARDFTVGQGIDCSYTVDSSLLSNRHRLLRKRRGVMYLVVPGGVACEFASGKTEKRVALDLLIALNLVERMDGGYAVPFRPGTAAILKIGDTTIGIEYTRAAQQAALEELPRELRRPRRTKNEKISLAILLASLVFNFFCVWQLQNMKIPKREAIEELEDRYAKLILEAPVVMKDLYKPEPVAKEAEKVPEEVKPAEKSPSRERSPAKGPKGDGGSVKGKGLLAYLDRQGAAGVLDSRELKNVLQGVGVLTTKRPSGQRMPGAAIGFREASGVDEMVAGIAARTGGAGGAGAGKKTTTSVGNPFDVSGTGSGHHLRSYQEIDRIIRQHLEGIRYLYERFLRTNPLLQGRVTLRFTINPAGAVTQVSVASFSLDNPSFHEELLKRVKLWKFPAIEPAAGSVSVVYPFTFLPKRN